jgi:hypothetical protein
MTEPIKLPGRNHCDTDGPNGTCSQCMVTDRLTAERDEEEHDCSDAKRPCDRCLEGYVE